MEDLTNYDRKLLEEAVGNYIDTLIEKEDYLEELKDELTVTQEVDEVINDGRLKMRRLRELVYKI